MANQNVNKKYSHPNNSVIKIFHQNMRGLRTKYNEILCHVQEYAPDVLCFTEHHLGKEEIGLLSLDNYLLGAHYSRQYFKKGGTCIYVLNTLKTTSVKLDNYCCDKDIEV
jgi:exonuclease III